MKFAFLIGLGAALYIVCLSLLTNGYNPVLFFVFVVTPVALVGGPWVVLLYARYWVYIWSKFVDEAEESSSRSNFRRAG